MLARLIEFALTQRLLVLLCMTLLIGGCAYAFKEIAIVPLPDVATTLVKTITHAHGMTTETCGAPTPDSQQQEEPGPSPPAPRAAGQGSLTPGVGE